MDAVAHGVGVVDEFLADGHNAHLQQGEIEEGGGGARRQKHDTRKWGLAHATQRKLQLEFSFDFPTCRGDNQNGHLPAVCSHSTAIMRSRDPSTYKSQCYKNKHWEQAATSINIQNVQRDAR